MPVPSGAFLAQGTLLQYDDTTPPITISEVRSIRGPTGRRDLVDVTNHESQGGYREFINGLNDAGELTFDINYIPTDGTHDATSGLLADFDSGLRRDFRLVFPDGAAGTPTTAWTFQGVVNGFEVTAAIDDALIASVTIKITGAPTFA